MKSVKVLFLILLSVTTILSGCSGKVTDQVGGDSKEKTIKIGVLYQNLQNEYIVALQDSIRKHAEQAGIKLIESDGQGKAENQISQVENLINQKVDAIILNPADRNGSAPVVDLAANAGIPLITVLAVVSNQDKVTAHVGSDDVEAGKIEMEYIAGVLGGKGTIAIIHGPNGNSAEINRTEGNYQILENYPDIKVAAEQTANWSREEALALTENWLQTHKLDAIAAQNDEMALGAVKALSAAGKLKDTKVIGIDAIPDALKSIEAGDLSGTVFQDVETQGEIAVDIAFKAGKGEEVKKDNMIPFQLITKENLSDFN
ncbi:sugar ABC transporter substrate-binding protein [Bacillus sp. FJAT-29790]|uniref:sugar ABC transporter substrate-binding protein n=1 Tax=Bacillus sp. FJAT-29790 TaxID=1895002 RepID=UPI001C21472D|nr:sugar ABC transporter substrate-binding protein [Bacillus sp. FJAT-29790]MBU8879843.1 sugar ABC transporter substrate-binding protein [Bacillus sp. FJAT-29790]